MANRAPANWAPAYWAPEILSMANWAPEILSMADWAPANGAPAYWAPWRQIGPRKICRWQICRWQIGPWQIGPLDNLDVANCIYPIQIYMYIGESMSVGIGFILPTIGEYMFL